MPYDYAGYNHRKYNFPQPVQPFLPCHNRQPTSWDPPWTRRRQPTCWDPPWTRRTTAYQHSSSYELDMYSPSPPKRRPTCWDPPVYRETPRQHPFNEVSVYDQSLAPVPNSRRNQPYTARAPPLPEPQPHLTPSPPYEQRTRRSYLPHSQPPLARSSSSGYTARQNANQRPLNASTSGDQFVEQEQPPRQPHCVRKSPNPGWFSQESHQQQFLPPKKQTCWDLPVPRQYVRSPVSDGPPARPTRRWDRPENRVQQQVSAYEPPAPTGWPPRPQPSPLRQPSCWDPPEQQGYPPHKPPTPVEPLDLECARFQPLPQPPQPHRYRRDVDEDRCYGEVVTHTHSPTLDMSLGSYVSGYVNERTNQNEVDSYLSSLDVQIAYSCLDCVDDRGKGDEELCDSKDSILETGAKEAMDRGMPSENRGSRESGDGRPEDQQVSSFREIYLSCSPDMSKDKKKEAWLDDVEEDDSTDEVKKVVASLNVVQVPSKNVVGHC